MKNQKKAVRYALCAVFLWSTVATAFKLALINLSYDELLFYAVLTSIAVMPLIVTVNRDWKFFDLRRDVKVSLVNGMMNPFVYYLLLFKAYDLLKAQEALALNYTWAVILTLLSVVILKQKIRKREILSVIISFTGALIIATRGNPGSFTIESPAGFFAAIGSAFCWAVFWIRNIKDRRPESVKLLSYFISGIIFITIYLLFNTGIKIHPVSDILPAVYVGAFEMGITFYFWSRALSYAENTAKISNLIYLSPFISMLLISLILHEEILLSSIAGLALIIGGIILSSLK